MTITRDSWARDLLTRMGYPVSDNNLTSVLAWEYQEGGHFANRATFNPLNTTRAHATYGSMNSAGVSTYPDYETGMTQTIKTLNLPAYSGIRRDLAASADPATTTAAIKASPWGTWHGGASTAGALRRARSDIAAHPTGTAASPAPATPAPAPKPTAAVPATTAAAATTATSAAAAATTGTAAAGTFLGADVDGLDHLAQEFTQAAQIVDEVKMVCEAIVAAASFFGPFGAAFVAYLKGTVIPWLTRIGEALQAMAKLLSTHSQAQKNASSSATSLPSYTAPTTTAPAGSTTTYPTLTEAYRPEPKPLAPGSVSVTKPLGVTMDRETLEELEGIRGAHVHPTVPINQVNGATAVYDATGEHYDVQVLGAKGSAADWFGLDPKDGLQAGAAASGSANLADVTVFTAIPLGEHAHVGLANETTLGVNAGGQLVAAVNPVHGTLATGASVQAFVGLQNTTSVDAVTPYFTNRTEITGQLGAGGAANAVLELGNGHLVVHAGAGAAVGLGGKIEDNLDVNYDAIVRDTETELGEVSRYLGGR